MYRKYMVRLILLSIVCTFINVKTYDEKNIVKKNSDLYYINNIPLLNI